MYKTNPLVRIQTAVPVDGKAAAVTRRGFKYEPRLRVVDSSLPLPMRKIDWKLRNNLEFIDFTGFIKGRLTVLGLSPSRGNDKQARWVCRCQCGRYVVRTVKALKNLNNVDDKCKECYHLDYLKKADTWRNYKQR